MPELILYTKMSSTTDGEVAQTVTKFAFGVEQGECDILDNVLHKIPVLASLADTQLKTHKTASGAFVYSNADLVHLKPIIKFATTDNPFFLLADLSVSENVIRVLELMDELCVTLPELVPVDILKGLRHTQGAHREYASKWDYWDESSERYIARQHVGLFALALYSGTFDMRETKVRHQVYESVLFVMSHPSTFHFRVRTHIKSLYDIRVKPYLTKKQDAIIKGWVDKYTDRNFYNNNEEDSPCDNLYTSSDSDDNDFLRRSSGDSWY